MSSSARNQAAAAAGPPISLPVHSQRSGHPARTPRHTGAGGVMVGLKNKSDRAGAECFHARAPNHPSTCPYPSAQPPISPSVHSPICVSLYISICSVHIPAHAHMHVSTSAFILHPSFLHPSLHPLLSSSISPSILPSIHLPIHPSTPSVHPVIDQFTHPFIIHSSIHPPISSTTYSSIHWSIQFSSVTQPCPTLCDPMNHSTPGLPVHHQLPEFTQTHVH